MLRLVFFALFVLVQTEHLMGVNYSFDVDFYNNFNSNLCDNDNLWWLVKYEDLNIKPPFEDSVRAIQAVGDSCASSFPIIFVGGTIDINVYSQDISQILNIIIEVLDKDDVCISTYVQRRPRIDIGPGWETIYLKVNKHTEGYIRFRGRSLKDEILLIDSFQYTPNDTINYDEKRSKRSFSDTEDEDELIFKYINNNINNNEYDKERIESSGEGENVTEGPTSTEQLIMEPKERRAFWNTFTISLVSFGVVVVVALLVVGAYHYGKVRAAENAPLPFVDVEPPRTIIIPRVTGLAGRSNRSSQLTFRDN